MITEWFLCASNNLCLARRSVVVIGQAIQCCTAAIYVGK